MLFSTYFCLKIILFIILFLQTIKIYLNPTTLLSTQDVQALRSQLQQVIGSFRNAATVLSVEEKVRGRKMGARRLAYAIAANRIGTQHENVMPRLFNAIDFEKVMIFANDLSGLASVVAQLQELIEDTQMAAGIDAMTYTKVVHDGLRSANNIDPQYDTALQELDEFNKRVAEEEANIPPTAV